MNTFSELGLSPEILQALPEMGIESPSEIQQKSIPILLGEKTDFIGLAQTGTGKTAAFGLPLLDSISTDLKYTQAVILAPTRELGQQIAQQLKAFSKHMPGVRVLAVYGGASITDQMRDLRKNPQIIIATPGRLIDLIKRKAIKLDQIDFVVLDEADEMLNMGFKEDLDIILTGTPAEKSTWLFSATMPREIKRITKSYMTNPAEVTISAGTMVNADITHKYMVVKGSDKTEALMRFLDVNSDMRGVVFTKTKRDSQSVADDLAKYGYPAEALNGDLSQNQRDHVMKRFKSHALQLLVATDVAARGIDVNDLTHVIHYSLPDDDAYYTHRSGRTGRAGKKGISLTLATKGDVRRVQFLERRLKIEFAKVVAPSANEIRTLRLVSWAEKIATTEPSTAMTSELLSQVESVFEGIDKTELISKLMVAELNKVTAHGEGRDLNAAADGRRSSSDRNDRRERGDRRERPERRESSGRRERPERKSTTKEPRTARTSSPGMNEFNINVGSIDGLNKAELLSFVIDQTGLSKTDIGAITVSKKASTFEVGTGNSAKVTKNFKELYIDEREIRVSQSGDGEGRRKGRSEGDKGNSSRPTGHRGKNGGTERRRRR